MTKEKRIYWNLKDEAINLILWGMYFGRGYGPVAKQST
jgi:hypothetical protein